MSEAASAFSVLYLDGYHLGDPLFPQGLARALGKRQPGAAPLVLVHGSGELAERRLEAEGYDVRRAGRVLDVRSAAERALVERSLRDVNQHIVSALSEEMVHAVGFQGSDRGLVQAAEGSGLLLGKTGWLEEVAWRGAVPVIAAGARGGAGVVEVDPAALAAALAERSGGVVVFVGRGARTAGGASEEVAAGALREEVYPEVDAVRLAVDRGVPAVLRWVPGLLSGGVRVVP